MAPKSMHAANPQKRTQWQRGFAPIVNDGQDGVLSVHLMVAILSIVSVLQMRVFASARALLCRTMYCASYGLTKQRVTALCHTVCVSICSSIFLHLLCSTGRS